ncbi:D-glycerate 3-kinase [Dipodascopsis uninucleata]
MTTSILQHLQGFVTQFLDKRDKPLVLGISGPQGSGKSFLSCALEKTLRENNLKVVSISLDDIYLDHKTLVGKYESTHSPLLARRGLPGTHDIELLKTLVSECLAKKAGEVFRIPRYDKSAFNGEGDRLPVSQWTEAVGPIDILIVEGWCLGFQPLEDMETALQILRFKLPSISITMEDLEFMNSELKKMNDFLFNEYQPIIDTLVHLDAQHLEYVYKWRAQQEVELHERYGSGMTPEQVVAFVDGYAPGYILYLEGLRKGILGTKGRQLRLVLGDQRQVLDVKVL